MNYQLSIVNSQLIAFRDFLQNELMSSPLTVRAYLDDVAAFASFVGEETKIEECSATDVRAFVMMMIERGDSPRSVNRRISSLRRFYNYLIRSGVIDTNPTASVRSLRQPQRLPHFVPESQMGAIVDELEQLLQSELYDEVRDAALVLTLYFTGMRRAEIASLEVEGIDFARGCIKVLGKGGKERLVPFGDELRDILQRYLIKRAEFCCANGQKSLFLKDGNKGLTVNDIYRTVNRTLKAEGVEARQSPHTLRHTFATHLLSGQAPIRSIQELLGHSSIASTEIYTHNTIESLKESFTQNHPRAKK